MAVKKVKVAIVGYGYWGPNILRNFNELENVSIAYCVDLKKERLEIVKSKYPTVEVTTDYQKVIKDPSVDALILSTPPSSHFSLAKQAISNGKHIWIEKPMTQRSREAKELINLARKEKRIIFVDHIFLYTEPVKTIKKLIDSGKVGNIYFFDSVRINLGLFQTDTNVLWDLAPHDISIMRYLLGKDPLSVSVFALSHVNPKIQDTAYLSFKFRNGISAHINVSWLSPVKIRRSILVADKKMIVYDDLESAESVKIYDRGVKRPRAISANTGYQYRIGDIQVPAIETKEALKSAAAHFIDCVQRNKKPLTDGAEGLKIVQILEACDKSMRLGGRFVKIENNF